ncbi:MAG: T9SS type A sorting domain-containing protein [Fibromonadaceae bacterium]|nr:T9SS type A sorting domain-containing protein [Fibromonadaceae bacterium]
MKKVLVLSLFAMAVLVSEALAAACTSGGSGLLCNWGDGKCWGIKSTDNSGTEVGCATQVANCESGGKLYKGAESSDGSCSGKTEFTCGGCDLGAGASVYCDYGPLLANGTGGCWEKAASEGCGNGGTEVTKQQCDDRNNAGVNLNAKLCYWEGDGTAANQCYCGLVQGAEATETNCTAEYGVIVTNCDGYCGASPPDPNPILKFTPASQALLVAPYGRSLHISSIKDATISLYDMSGARVYSGRVRAGNSVFGLEKVPAGSYYAIVQSGSNYKKVAVVLK